MPDWTELNAYGDKRHDDKSLIAVWAYFCHRCGYIWLPKDFDIYDDDTLDRRPPKSCARCKSKYYDMIPRDEHRPEQPFYVGIRQDMRRRKEKAASLIPTRVVNVREYKPYSSYWYNQPPDSPYTYVGRAVQYFGRVIMPITSKWHNPYHLKKKDDMAERLEAIRWYKEDHLPGSGLLDQLHELKDKVLGCWCKPLPCHGDVLAELVNRLN